MIKVVSKTIVKSDESLQIVAASEEFDSSKARRELGYTTRSYRETMRDEIAWLKESGKSAV